MTNKKNLFQQDIRIINVGLQGFSQAIKEQDVPVQEIDWRPPADGDANLINILDPEVIVLGGGLSNISFLQNWDFFISNLGIAKHYERMSKGVLDSRDIMYFLSVCFLFLILEPLQDRLHQGPLRSQRDNTIALSLSEPQRSERMVEGKPCFCFG